MKKIFTLISMALFAIGVNAQEVFDISSIMTQNTDGKYNKIADGKVQEVENKSENNKKAGSKDAPLAKGTDAATAFAQATPVTLTNYTVEASTASCTMTIVSTPNENDNSAENAWSISDQTGANGALSTDACSPKFNVYLSGKGNPTATYFGYWVINENGDTSFQCPNEYQTFWTPESGTIPAKGSFSTFKVSQDGTLRIGVRIPKAGKNRKVYFVNQATGAILAQDKYNAEGYDNNNTNEYTSHTTTDYVVATDVNNQFIGYINVTLPANETYILFSPDTQIGIYGFYFSGETGISTVKANNNSDAPIYNLAGQKVSESYKGVVIQNGRKRIQ